MHKLVRKMDANILKTIALTIVIVALSTVIAKPIDNHQSVAVDEYRTSAHQHERDPMMALPTGQQPRTSGHHQPTEIEYVHYVHEPVQPEAQVEYQQQQAQQMQPQHQPRQVVIHNQAAGQQAAPAPYQLVQVVEEPHRHGDGVACNQKHQEYVMSQPTEQAALSPSGEYPGEIIYVGQDGQVVQPSQVGDQSGSENPFAKVAETLNHNSALAATILTEIPVKDMPSNVLEKLKRDFGVKVVATRERPGANLVINCDEYSSQENSICARSSHGAHNSRHYELAEHQADGVENSNQADGGENVNYGARHYEPTNAEQDSVSNQEEHQQYHPTRIVHSPSPADESSTLVEAQPEGGEYQSGAHYESTHGERFEHREIIYTTPARSTQDAESAPQHERPRQAHPSQNEDPQAGQIGHPEEHPIYRTRTTASIPSSASASTQNGESATEPTMAVQEDGETAQSDHSDNPSSPQTTTTMSYTGQQSGQEYRQQQRQQQHQQESQQESSPSPSTVSDQHQSSPAEPGNNNNMVFGDQQARSGESQEQSSSKPNYNHQ